MRGFFAGIERPFIRIRDTGVDREDVIHGDILLGIYRAAERQHGCREFLMYPAPRPAQRVAERVVHRALRC